MKRLKAIYEGGMLKPLEQLPLNERQVVTLFLAEADDVDLIDEFGEDVLDLDAMATADREGDTEISLDQLRQILSSIPGSMSDVIIEERGEY
jgi:predicted DNA-binding antitoxin AbrB/MazE fold protein